MPVKEIAGAAEVQEACRKLAAAKNGDLELRLAEVLIASNQWYAKYLKPNGKTASGIVRAARPAPKATPKAKPRT